MISHNLSAKNKLATFNTYIGILFGPNDFFKSKARIMSNISCGKGRYIPWAVPEDSGYWLSGVLRGWSANG